MLAFIYGSGVICLLLIALLPREHKPSMLPVSRGLNLYIQFSMIRSMTQPTYDTRNDPVL